MVLAEEVAEEVEALEAIFGLDALERVGDDGVRLTVSPEPDGDGHVFGSAVLNITFPEGYPGAGCTPPSLIVEPGARLTQEAAAAVQAVAEQMVEAECAAGGVVVFAAAEAVREWLQEHAGFLLTPPPTPPAQGDNAEIAKCEDFDVDSSDLDDELIDALQEVLPQQRQELRRIRRLGAGQEQRQALRAVLRAMTPAQREELVGSSSDSEAEGEDQAPAAAGGQAKAPPVKLPKAEIDCPVGHALTAYSSRPPDYRRFDDGDYTCDICGRDGVYKKGVYHCTKCFAQGGKQFDACPDCGVGKGPSAVGGKKQKNKGKKR